MQDQEISKRPQVLLSKSTVVSWRSQSASAMTASITCSNVSVDETFVGAAGRSRCDIDCKDLFCSLDWLRLLEASLVSSAIEIGRAFVVCRVPLFIVLCFKN